MEQKLTRRVARENAFLLAFSATFDEQDIPALVEQANEVGEHPVDAFGQKLIQDYYEHTAEIDDLIQSHLKGWTMNRLPRVSLVALRLALSEMLYGEEKLPGVAINEIVELTKRYGAEDDYQFVNGVLGAISREMGLADSDAPVQG